MSQPLLTPRRSPWTQFLTGMMLVLLMVLAVTPAPVSVYGQDGEEASAEAEPAAATKAEGAPAEGAETPAAKQSTLWWLIKTSGWIGAVLLVISIYFVSKVMQLFIDLREQVVMPPALIEQVEQLRTQRNYKGIFQAARESDSELGTLVAAGMEAMQYGLEEARDAIERAGEVITVNMEKKISMLAVIGSLGPMIGLLGTLKGMISSFSVIALGENQLKASEVAEGISEALVLTFEGVALSVPAIYFFALFKNRVSTLSVEAENIADQMIRTIYFSAQQRSAPAAAQAAAPAQAPTA